MKNHTATLQSWRGPGHGEGPATQRTPGARFAVLCRRLPHPSILWHSEACRLLLPLQAGLRSHVDGAGVDRFVALLSGLIFKSQEGAAALCLPESFIPNLYAL